MMALQRYFGGREEQRLVYVTLLVAFFVETITFNKQSTTQPHQIHGPHFFFPFRYGT
jgi:hypothetical protein